MALCKYKSMAAEAEAVRKYFFGEIPDIMEVPLNDKMVDVMNQMLADASDAQKAINLLPNNPGFIPGVGSVALYVFKLGRGILKDALGFRAKGHMLLVKRAVVFNYADIMRVAIADGADACVE